MLFIPIVRNYHHYHWSDRPGQWFHTQLLFAAKCVVLPKTIPILFRFGNWEPYPAKNGIVSGFTTSWLIKSRGEPQDVVSKRAMLHGLLPASYCTLDDRGPNQLLRNFLVHENGFYFKGINKTVKNSSGVNGLSLRNPFALQ